jgi:sortase B
MNRKLRTVLIAVLSVIFAVSAYMVISYVIQYQKGKKNYEQARALVRISSSSSGTGSTPSASFSISPAAPYESTMKTLSGMDITALQRVNDDIVGWIEIPGTAVSYPLLKGTDNQYYLTHTWNKSVLSVGAIFLESKCSRSLTDFNSIIYGHNMKNGSMFAAIRSYSSKDFWSAHQNVYIVDETGVRRYEVFSAYQVSASGKAYQIGFQDDTAKQDFISFCTHQTSYKTGVTPSVNDKILTLSTCIGSDNSVRWVVQGVLRGTAERSYTP